MNEHLVSIAAIVVCLIVAVAVGLAGSQDSVTLAGIPLFLLCGIASFTIQWLCFIPAFAWQTERFYDLTGSATYISLTLLVLLSSGFSEPRALLIGALVMIWASRLGTFLFKRVSEAGEDRRFRAAKPVFLRFAMFWTIQGLWVYITYAAGLAAMTSASPVPLDVFAVIGGLLWLAGFTIEVVSDRQKSAFRRDPANKGRFISTGLWAWSRHPNYFGEILLWLGITVIAVPVLSGWQYVTLISPIFVVVLLTRISGLPMLESRAKKLWGNDEEYQAYKKATPVLIPRPPR